MINEGGESEDEKHSSSTSVGLTMGAGRVRKRGTTDRLKRLGVRTHFEKWIQEGIVIHIAADRER